MRFLFSTARKWSDAPSTSCCRANFANSQLTYSFTSHVFSMTLSRVRRFINKLTAEIGRPHRFANQFLQTRVVSVFIINITRVIAIWPENTQIASASVLKWFCWSSFVFLPYPFFYFYFLFRHISKAWNCYSTLRLLKYWLLIYNFACSQFVYVVCTRLPLGRHLIAES